MTTRWSSEGLIFTRVLIVSSQFSVRFLRMEDERDLFLNNQSIRQEHVLGSSALVPPLVGAFSSLRSTYIEGCINPWRLGAGRHGE
jgi:hypothetical protein